MQENILKTLAYFDILDYPLTRDEIFVYLWSEDFKEYSFESLKNDLEILSRQNKIGIKNDFYFLKNRSQIVELRKLRKNISLNKIKKARWMIKFLRFNPWIKAVFICSGLGLLNAKDDSDIDFLIITQKNRIWLARFWSAGILKLLGLRPDNKKTKDRFCLSHFITEDNLSLQKTSIKEDDVHLIYLLSYYLPIYAEDDLWHKFIGANLWIKKYLPNFVYNKDKEKLIIKPVWFYKKRLLRKMTWNKLEKLVKKIQLWYFPKILRQMMNKDNRVIINDKMLKLHSNDSRDKVYDSWKEKLAELGGE